jgi:hypothetical protein
MEWLILFIVSWILFFFLVDYKALKSNIWCGLLAVFLQLVIDTNSIQQGRYSINNSFVSILGSSICFVLGPVIVMATLLAQFHPEKRWIRILNIFAFSALYSLQELLLLLSGSLTYNAWIFFDSLIINTIVMMALSWFSIVVLKKKGDA